MKRCLQCKETKPLSEFSKHRSKKDGLQGYCKSCNKAHWQQYQQTPNSKAAHRKAVAKNQQTPKGKAAHRKADAKRKANNPNYVKATSAVNTAIRAGKLPRPDSQFCHYCSKPAQQYHHWHGYEPEHWLDVVPVCLECHKRIQTEDEAAA